MPTTLRENRPSAGIGVVEVQNPWFFAISKVPARPSAGIGVVEVQKLEVFCDFCPARTTLCRDRRGRGAKTRGFLRFLPCSRNPLRGSAWSRCKNSRFFAISALLAQPSAGIGVVEVQKLVVFLRFLPCSRNPLRGSAWRGRGAKTRGFCDFCCSNWSSGVVSWFARLLPEPAGRGFDSSLVRGRESQDATCILMQLAQSNLRRASCTEQLAQSKLHRATCADQLAPTSLRRAPCLVLSRACFTNASCREKERILQHWADLACDVLLSGQPWSSVFDAFLILQNPQSPSMISVNSKFRPSCA